MIKFFKFKIFIYKFQLWCFVGKSIFVSDGSWDVFLEPRDSANLSVLKTTEQELRLAPSPHFRDKSLGNPCSSLTVLLGLISFHVAAYIFYTHSYGYRYQTIRCCQKFSLVDFRSFFSTCYFKFQKIMRIYF